MPWELVVGQPKAQFEATVDNLAGAGYRPISIASRERAGVSEYAGIFVRDGLSPDRWTVMLGYDAMQLASETETAWDDGYYPFRGSYEQGAQDPPRFNVLWIQRSPELKLEMRYNMDDVLFEQEDRSFRGRGYHLESASSYFDGGATRIAGLWVRHQPYLRWEELSAIPPDNPTYIARYKPFHDQVIQTMTLAGEAKQGEFFRPSSTLHIYEGGTLVLDRAYTYAPAIYPDTPLDASMPRWRSLARASRSRRRRWCGR